MPLVCSPDPSSYHRVQTLERQLLEKDLNVRCTSILSDVVPKLWAPELDYRRPFRLPAVATSNDMNRHAARGPRACGFAARLA